MQTETDLPQPGRPVRLEPTAPGFWMTVLGTCLAGLAPLFGFLIGSSIGDVSGEPMFPPIYWGLFLGVVIGGVGVLCAVIGGRRLWQKARSQNATDDHSGA